MVDEIYIAMAFIGKITQEYFKLFNKWDRRRSYAKMFLLKLKIKVFFFNIWISINCPYRQTTSSNWAQLYISTLLYSILIYLTCVWSLDFFLIIKRENWKMYRIIFSILSYYSSRCCHQKDTIFFKSKLTLMFWGEICNQHINKCTRNYTI